MKIGNISQIKNQLSRYLDYVRKGGRVRILDRNIPVADLVPIAGSKGLRGTSRLAALERAGKARLGGGSLAAIWSRGPTGQGGVLRALLEDREEA